MPYSNYEQWRSTPISDRPYLSIVIPTYNEEWRILPTIGAIASHVSDLGFDWELIISDDGSTDSTVELVEDLDFANVCVIKGPHEGKGGAVKRGMLQARGFYVLFADSDNSTPIEEVSRFLRSVSEEGYDIAVGSRAAEGAQEVNRSAMRQFMSDGLRRLVRTVLRIPVQDTQCGFKMFRAEAAHRLHSVQTIRGFSFDLEILHLASKWGYTIAELPVAWVDAPGSKVDTVKDSMRFARDLAIIEVNELRGVYNRGPGNAAVPQGQVS